MGAAPATSRGNSRTCGLALYSPSMNGGKASHQRGSPETADRPGGPDEPEDDDERHGHVLRDEGEREHRQEARRRRGEADRAAVDRP